MPGKSKHGKGKRPQYRNRARQPVNPSSVNATGSVASAPATAGAVNVSAPAKSPKTAAGKINAKTLVYSGATAEQYPFFISELKRIGVLTGVILIILVILGLIIR
jgi:hypothetical protein